VVGAVAGALGAVAGSAGIVIVYVVFLLLEQSIFERKLHALLRDPGRAERLHRLLARIARQIQGYLWVKTLSSLLAGTVSFAIMWTVGVDFAAFWALVIFLLNFIPIIGALLGVTFPSLLALVQFEALGPFLVTSLALAGAQFVVSNLIEPRLMGRKLHLSPLVIILSLAFWGGLWGVVGMILCIPIMVIVMIICAHFAPTRPIAIVLSSDGEIDWDEAAAAP
jgi:AI-2 transport protein TqsA